MMSTMIRGTVTVGAQTHVFGHLPHLTVGSSTHDDIVVDDPLVTAGHLRIDWRSTGWWVSADAAAPAYTAGVAVTEILIADVTRIRIGDSDDGPVLIFALTDSDPVDDDTVQLADAPRTLTCAPDGISLRYTASDTVIDIHGILTVGRTPDNDLVIDDPLVSRHHARIALQSDGDLLVDDLASSNGTHVDGRRITRARLPDGSVLTVGNTDFVVRGRQLLRGETPTAGDGLMLHGVGLTLGADTTLLRDAEFTARPGTLTAVIGPSGAGKSTVAAVMAGLTTPTAGVVTFDGRDVHGEYDTLHTRIGMVPQSDVLHRRLTLRHALRYAAEIRLPGDLAADDRNRVVAGVLAELHLTEHLDTRIDMLSGGQRKRASMAMELLTGPSLLILDEPTSGLDPALDRQVMAALRRLANAGRVVLVVTHSLANLTLCDQVVMLAPGGRTAFVGRPEEIPIAFGTTDWAEIFTVLTANPVLAHRRHLERTRATAPPNPVRRPTGAPVCVPRVSAIDQCSTVVRRQIRLIVADPGYLTFLAVLPVVLGLLTLIVPGAAGFGVNEASATAGEALQILVILVVGATFMGTALTVRDLVAERDIFPRERAVGLRAGAYLAAKVLVFSAAAICQTAVMLAITFAGNGTPRGGLVGAAPLELFGILAALAAVSAVVGLAVSASVRSVEQTMPPLVVLVLAQLVLCGGLFRLTTPVLAQLPWLFPSYWGYTAAAGAVDLKAISPLAPQTADAAIWESELSNAVLAYSALLLITTVLLVVTMSRLTDRGGRVGGR